ncbi:hypothetical protein PPGU16_01520 [Paraburkholderia largidicola]|uniref:Uncharacterized protein n=1 Tax=Paraburkholderia largidicola TaxID=3014751 RepID=A0A7I8BEX4_9BURK|nr:hypothetical protein PPGU16_01520 [Paraburkholderia sp. PGU16]
MPGAVVQSFVTGQTRWLNRGFNRYVCESVTTMTVHPFNVSLAFSDDIESLVELDSVSRCDFRRSTFIGNAVNAAQCWIATESGDVPLIVGYGVLNRTLFEQDFVPLVTGHLHCIGSGNLRR